ncbi:hypothetical protein B0H14DRAFT_3510227 [Mycena olivaceomarginata]|nr:hypothetical protein B0H14DRAFT_3510227 [Mycena olivaceomarginata]
MPHDAAPTTRPKSTSCTLVSLRGSTIHTLVLWNAHCSRTIHLPNRINRALRLDTPSTLEAHIGTARHAVTDTYRDAHAHVQVRFVLSPSPLSSPPLFLPPLYSHFSISCANTDSSPKSLLPPDEPLLPGALYAAIALLVTSILTRHRALPLRAALPPLAAAPFAYYLPTSPRTSARTPARSRTRICRRWRTCTRRRRRTVVKAVKGLQWATGLRVGEALGVSREVGGRVEKVA